MSRRIILLLVVIAGTGIVVWAVVRFTAARRNRPRQPANELSNLSSTNADAWNQAVEKVKADRGEAAGGAIEIPPELKHYTDRHWFLATQVAEIEKYNVQTCQDFVDLAAMIQHGELVAVPAVTDAYVLYGVGAKADDGVFTRYQDDHNIELYNDAQLDDAYRRLDEKRSNLRSEIAALKAQSGRLSRRDRTKQSELQKEITAREQELKSADDDKALLDKFYGQPDTRQKLMGDYESLQALAKNFGGRSYNLDDLSDRRAMKIHLL